MVLHALDTSAKSEVHKPFIQRLQLIFCTAECLSWRNKMMMKNDNNPVTLVFTLISKTQYCFVYDWTCTSKSNLPPCWHPQMDISKLRLYLYHCWHMTLHMAKISINSEDRMAAHSLVAVYFGSHHCKIWLPLPLTFQSHSNVVCFSCTWVTNLNMIVGQLDGQKME